MSGVVCFEWVSSIHAAGAICRRTPMYGNDIRVARGWHSRPDGVASEEKAILVGTVMAAAAAATAPVHCYTADHTPRLLTCLCHIVTAIGCVHRLLVTSLLRISGQNLSPAVALMHVPGIVLRFRSGGDFDAGISYFATP
jgi:hypothetical protein